MKDITVVVPLKCVCVSLPLPLPLSLSVSVSDSSLSILLPSIFGGMAPIGCVGLPQDCDIQPHDKPKESK